MDGAYRCSLTLPALQAKLLSNVAKRVGCSQSALVSILLEETLECLALGLGDAPDVPPRRWGGPHVDDVRRLIAQALEDGRQIGPPLL